MFSHVFVFLHVRIATKSYFYRTNMVRNMVNIHKLNAVSFIRLELVRERVSWEWHNVVRDVLWFVIRRSWFVSSCDYSPEKKEKKRKERKLIKKSVKVAKFDVTCSFTLITNAHEHASSAKTKLHPLLHLWWNRSLQKWPLPLLGVVRCKAECCFVVNRYDIVLRSVLSLISSRPLKRNFTY